MILKISLDGGKTERAIVKACACGLSFTEHEWLLLRFVGTMLDPESRIELRNCPCGSTIGVEGKP